MASQLSKKEDFSRYLEKGGVLDLLTTVLTDLFEMENKPEDPLRYIHQRFGEKLSPQGPKDATMTDVAKPAPAQDLSKEAVPPSQTPVQQVAEPVPKVVTVPSPAQQAQPVPVPAALPTNPTPPVQQTESALQAKIPETVDTPVAAPVQQTTAQ